MESRRVSRQPAGWAGLCHVQGDSAVGWRDCEVIAAVGWMDCEVIDVSVLGVGITFHYPRPFDLVGRQISVELPSADDSVNIRLEGDIRNTALVPGGVRVGIEFVGASREAEQTITAVLSRMGGALVTN
jgi:hypothetical protein